MNTKDWQTANGIKNKIHRVDDFFDAIQKAISSHHIIMEDSGMNGRKTPQQMIAFIKKEIARKKKLEKEFEQL